MSARPGLVIFTTTPDHRQARHGSIVKGPHLGLFHLLFLLLVNFFGGCGSQPPHLTVTPMVIELQYEKDNPVQSGGFTLKNIGGMPLKILSISSSCSCSVAELPADLELSPGEMQELQFKASPPVIGGSIAFLEIATDCPRQPVVEVTVKLQGGPQTVPQLLYCTESVELRGAEAGAMVIGEIEMRTIEQAGSSHWINEIVSPTDTVQTLLREPVIEVFLGSEFVDRLYIFQVQSVVPETGTTTFVLTPRFTSLPMGTNSNGRIRPLVITERLEPIQFVPAEITADPGSQVSEDLQFFARDDQPFQIRSVTLVHGAERKSLPGLSSKERKLHHLIRVETSLLHLTPPPADCCLELETSHPDAPVVTVPISFSESRESKQAELFDCGERSSEGQ